MGATPFRVGLGYDVHAFAGGRKLFLGGVEVPYERGLAGHSDADVLTHAICDAILGALARGDIGRHFPDNDPQFENIDSLLLLDQCVALAREDGFAVAQIDATVIAQAPKLSPYIDVMVGRLRDRIREQGGGECVVNVKATTTERLGFEGRGEGIAAQAVVMLFRD